MYPSIWASSSDAARARRRPAVPLLPVSANRRITCNRRRASTRTGGGSWISSEAPQIRQRFLKMPRRKRSRTEPVAGGRQATNKVHVDGTERNRASPQAICKLYKHINEDERVAIRDMGLDRSSTSSVGDMVHKVVPLRKERFCRAWTWVHPAHRGICSSDFGHPSWRYRCQVRS